MKYFKLFHRRNKYWDCLRFFERTIQAMKFEMNQFFSKTEPVCKHFNFLCKLIKLLLLSELLGSFTENWQGIGLRKSYVISMQNQGIFLGIIRKKVLAELVLGKFIFFQESIIVPICALLLINLKLSQKRKWLAKNVFFSASYSSIETLNPFKSFHRLKRLAISLSFFSNPFKLWNLNQFQIIF